jgi:cytochrome c-type biogenesis protein CcmH/NrfF
MRLKRVARWLWWFRPWNRVRLQWIEDQVVVAESVLWLWPAALLLCFAWLLDRVDRSREGKPPSEFLIFDA